MKIRSVIVFVYNSADDPLFKGNLLPLLQLMSSIQPDLRFHLITYEQKRYHLSAGQRQQLAADWAGSHITWYPLTWHSGRLKLLKKAYDLFMGLLLCWRLRLRGARTIMGMCTVAGSFAFLIAKTLRLRYFNFQYEPHSEFMRECGVWSAQSWSYRSLHYVEGLVGRHADMLSTGTHHMLKRLEAWKSPAKVYYLPTSVDESRFTFSSAGRAEVRARYGLTAEQPIIVYLGKFGDLYYGSEIGDLFQGLLLEMPTLHLLVVTPDAPHRVREFLEGANLPADAVTITSCTYEEVPAYISAADFGLVAVPPLPSQRFRSPIKVGEYLCCGLPYLVCQGVSEDDEIARQYKVGVIAQAYSVAEGRRVAPQIAAFLAENKVALRQRCRETGIMYRGLTQFIPTAIKIFSQL